MAKANKVPVTVLSGFLGAGKTTLLQHILSNKEGLRIGMIVNDMSEVNVDASLIENGGAGVVRLEDKVVELSNGCICCTLREDLLKVMIKLASEKRFDYLVIESSGISEPQPVAETFTFIDEESGKCLADFARLDTCVTVVDAYNWLRDYTSPDSLAERSMSAFEGDQRGVVDLLIDQVEFADVLVINKTDMVPEGDLERLKAILTKLNPHARVVQSSFSRVPLASVLNTDLFNIEDAAASPGWLKELRGTHNPETLEYGISSLIYRARRPFHPARLHDLLCRSGSTLPGMPSVPAADISSGAVLVAEPIFSQTAPAALARVLRSKGYFWLAVDGGMDEVGMWSQAGRVWQFTAGRPWWATLPKQSWPPGLADILLGKKKAPTGAQQPPAWDKTYGDRGTEIVLIGVGLDAAAVRAELDACLLSESELASGQGEWDGWEDPFDFYEYEDDEEEDSAECGEEGDAHQHGPGCDHNDGSAHESQFAQGHSHQHGDECAHGHGHNAEGGVSLRDGPKIARLVVTR